MKTMNSALPLAALLIAGCQAQSGAAVSSQEDLKPAVEVTGSAHATSPAVRDLPPAISRTDNADHPVKALPLHGTPGTTDGAVQTQPLPLVSATGGLSFAGVGNGDYGFAPNAAPPDTNGAVGATQYVQWVNESFGIFSKATGALVSGPTAGNQLFAALGASHPCAVNNDGDPIAQYDKLNGRWVLSQFSVTNGGTQGYFQCVAVSTSSDATGTYNVYAFPQPGFNDYPKVSVWPDAYYVTYNMFTGNTFNGGRVCAMDGAAMRAGTAATQQCFQLSASYGGLLASDLDGPASPPPAGTPAFVLNFGTNSLNLWKFHVDFANSANSTLTGPTNLPVAAFTEACGGGTCIQQPGTRQQLDSLADRLMYRLAYRHFADHDALVANHTVQVSGGRKSSVNGIRWYELRNPATAPTVYQQGTFSPDTNNRWMASAAMDKVGNIAIGYSVSSSTVFPAIRFTGRVPGDALGSLETESSLLSGGGSQTTNLNRWGDYSALTVDPVDDCTFWYTTEYEKSSGTFNWSTHISSFKFPTCL